MRTSLPNLNRPATDAPHCRYNLASLQTHAARALGLNLSVQSQTLLYVSGQKRVSVDCKHMVLALQWLHTRHMHMVRTSLLPVQDMLLHTGGGTQAG